MHTRPRVHVRHDYRLLPRSEEGLPGRVALAELLLQRKEEHIRLDRLPVLQFSVG